MTNTYMIVSILENHKYLGVYVVHGPVECFQTEAVQVGAVDKFPGVSFCPWREVCTELQHIFYIYCHW